MTGTGLDGLLATLVAADGPGLAVGVYRDGELAASAALGCAVVEHGVPVTEHTAFDIASVSKHITAACLLFLVRDGLLDLATDVRSILPELGLAQPVTLRQCLTHTAGLRDYFALCDLAGIPVMGITEDRAMDLIAGQQDLDFAPGSAFSYSNTGYVLAAAVVRRITGQGLAAFAAERVFGPLGMTMTRFRDDASSLVPGMANGYLAAGGVGGVSGDGFRRCDVTEDVVGDGAVVTTIADLAPWHRFLVSGAGLGTDIRDGLLSRQVLTDGTRLGYALGLDAISVGGEAAWWHSGSWAGYRSAVIYLPGQRAGVTVLANRNDRPPSQIAVAVARALVSGDDLRSCYELAAGIPVPKEEARRESNAVVGHWHEPDQDLFLELREAGPGDIVTGRAGSELWFRLGTDGLWHGVGIAAGSTYTLRDGMLVAGWGLSELPEAVYRRARAESDSPAVSVPIPAGTYRSDELAAYADVSAGPDGAIITIGLASPRRLAPAGPGTWSVDGVTARMDADGSGLLVSTPGARRVRFARVTSPPAGRDTIRGTSGATQPSA